MVLNLINLNDQKGLIYATNEYFNFLGNTNFIPIWTTLIANLILFLNKKKIVRDLVLFLERTDFDFFLFCDREHDGERFLSTVNPINIWLQREHLGLYTGNQKRDDIFRQCRCQLYAIPFSWFSILLPHYTNETRFWA